MRRACSKDAADADETNKADSFIMNNNNERVGVKKGKKPRGVLLLVEILVVIVGPTSCRSHMLPVYAACESNHYTRVSRNYE